MGDIYKDVESGSLLDYLEGLGVYEDVELNVKTGSDYPLLPISGSK